MVIYILTKRKNVIEMIWVAANSIEKVFLPNCTVTGKEWLIPEKFSKWTSARTQLPVLETKKRRTTFALLSFCKEKYNSVFSQKLCSCFVNSTSNMYHLVWSFLFFLKCFYGNVWNVPPGMKTSFSSLILPVVDRNVSAHSSRSVKKSESLSKTFLRTFIQIRDGYVRNKWFTIAKRL